MIQIDLSPIIALNRIVALSKVKGKQVAIAAAEKLNLINNHFFCVLLGDLYKKIDATVSKSYYHTALKLAKTNTDRSTIQFKLNNE